VITIMFIRIRLRCIRRRGVSRLRGEEGICGGVGGLSGKGGGVDGRGARGEIFGGQGGLKGKGQG
jgi:hypothetical protein